MATAPAQWPSDHCFPFFSRWGCPDSEFYYHFFFFFFLAHPDVLAKPLRARPWVCSRTRTPGKMKAGLQIPSPASGPLVPESSCPFRKVSSPRSVPPAGGRFILIKTWVLTSFLPLRGHVQLFVTSWTVARQAPLSVEFSRHEFCSGLPFPTPGNLPHPGIEHTSPALQANSYRCATWEAPSEHTHSGDKPPSLRLWWNSPEKSLPKYVSHTPATSQIH